jgi:hypothetical protein
MSTRTMFEVTVVVGRQEKRMICAESAEDARRVASEQDPNCFPLSAKWHDPEDDSRTGDHT